MVPIAWPEKFPVFETQRLLLRQVSSADEHGIFQSCSDPAVMKYISTPLDNRDAVQGIREDYMDGFADGSSLIWAIAVKQSGVFAGTAGFEGFSFLDSRADIGFTLNRLHQGKGYMTEALLKILSFGFITMSINRIQATVVPENTSSVKLLERLGFSEEGHMKKSVFFNGSFHDELIFALLSTGKNSV